MNIINFTPAAVEATKEYHKNLQITDDCFLRIGINQKNAVDKGLLIGFDTKTEKDKEIVIDGIKIIYHPAQVLFFAGMIIDFMERNGKSGFVLKEKKV